MTQLEYFILENGVHKKLGHVFAENDRKAYEKAQKIYKNFFIHYQKGTKHNKQIFEKENIEFLKNYWEIEVIKNMPKWLLNATLKKLNRIDKLHESKKISDLEHDRLSEKCIEKALNMEKNITLKYRCKDKILGDRFK